MLGSWILLAFLNCFHNSCLKIDKTVRVARYFLLTLNLALLFSVAFASMTTLYNFTLLTPNDTFNSALGVLLSIFFFVAVCALWILTFLTTPPLSKNDRTVHVDKEIIFDIPEESDKRTENSNKRRSVVEDLSEDMHSDVEKTTLDGNGEKKEDQVLDYDYLSLYKHASRVAVNGQTTVVFTKAKYFLPLLITKVYLTAILSSLLQDKPFHFFILSSFLELVLIFFTLIVKPFTSKFTNFRIIVLSLGLIAANTSIGIYIHISQSNDYQIFYEELTAYIILGVLASATLFIILEHLLAWSREMWRLVEPCLKGTRLMGHRAARLSEE